MRLRPFQSWLFRAWQRHKVIVAKRLFYPGVGCGRVRNPTLGAKIKVFQMDPLREDDCDMEKETGFLGVVVAKSDISYSNV